MSSSTMPLFLLLAFLVILKKWGKVIIYGNSTEQNDYLLKNAHPGKRKFLFLSLSISNERVCCNGFFASVDRKETSWTREKPEMVWGGQVRPVLVWLYVEYVLNLGSKHEAKGIENSQQSQRSTAKVNVIAWEITLLLPFIFRNEIVFIVETVLEKQAIWGFKNYC